MAEVEVPLAGGNVADAVVGVGMTLPKQVTATTPAVQAVLRHLHQVVFHGAPRTLSRDEQSRQALQRLLADLNETSAHALRLCLAPKPAVPQASPTNRSTTSLATAGGGGDK